jgi:hypothetical protein
MFFQLNIEVAFVKQPIAMFIFYTLNFFDSPHIICVTHVKIWYIFYLFSN